VISGIGKAKFKGTDFVLARNSLSAHILYQIRTIEERIPDLIA